MVRRVLRQLFALRIFGLLSLALLCSCGKKPENSDFDGSIPVFNSSSCLFSFPSHRFRQVAYRFTQSEPEKRSKLLKSYQKALSKGQIQGDKRFHQLLEYLEDAESSAASALDGAHLPFRALEDREWKVLIFDSPELLGQKKAHRLVLQKDVHWSGYLIPKHLMVKNYPLFRGSRHLAASLSSLDELTQADSPVFSALKDLFTIGLENPNRSFNSPKSDVFQHTLSSDNSRFLSSSMDFRVATRFSIDPENVWSAVVEFRGVGVDVNKTSAYFSQYSFLSAGRAHHQIEREIVVTASRIQAHDIRGVWFFRNKPDKASQDRQVFIPNPNYQSRLAEAE